MTSPDPFSEEEAAARFDDALRQQLGDFEAVPAPAAWETLRVQLPSPRSTPSAWRQRLTTFGGGVVVGALLWWGANEAPHLPAAPAPAITEVAAPDSATPPAPTEVPNSVNEIADSRQGVGLSHQTQGLSHQTQGLSRQTSGLSRQTSGLSHQTSGLSHQTSGLSRQTLGLSRQTSGLSHQTSGLSHQTLGLSHQTLGLSHQTLGLSHQTSGLSHQTSELLASVAVDTASVSASGAVASPGGTGNVLTGALAGVEARDSVIQELVRAYQLPVAAVADTGRAAALRTLVVAQTRALAALTARLDSVKQFLPEAPPALAPVVAAADSAAAWPTLPPPRAAWSVLLLAETTPSWAVQPTRGATASQEQTVAVLSQQALGQWQATPRWAVRAGLGQTTLTTQARTVAERISELTNVTSTTTLTFDNTTDTTYSTIVHLNSVARYEPVLNGSGQIIRYDTVWVVYKDTIVSTNVVTIHDTSRTTVETRATQTLRERQTQQFRPVYRFWTVPVAVRYSLLTTPRWTLGAVLGGQLHLLRDAQRPVWTGEQYELRRVSARETPYRALSVALSAGLEAQYRLSPRLSAVVAPSVRWWALSTTRDGAGPRPFLPAATVGLSWGF